MEIPGFASLAAFSRYTKTSYMAIRNQMINGYCAYPRRRKSNTTKNSAYKCWENMIQRCYNPKANKYDIYGGRGINVHPIWKSSFMEFITYIGPRPSHQHSIDRIDVNGSYVPGNVRWATHKEQNENKRIIPPTNAYGIEKHGKKYRFSYKNVRYTLNSESEAIKLRTELYERGNGSGKNN